MPLPWFQRRSRGTTDREPAPQITMFGGIAQRRDAVGVFPQEPPEAIRQGVDTPSRPARWPIAVLTGMDPQTVAEGRFIAAIVGPAPHATYPRERQVPVALRSNIRVPSHVAYGTLFTSAPPYAGQ